jgi:hypothetical protein
MNNSVKKFIAYIATQFGIQKQTVHVVLACVLITISIMALLSYLIPQEEVIINRDYDLSEGVDN